MDAIDRLVATEAIRAVKARYFRCVDTKDWATLATVFAPDIVFDRGFGDAVQDPATGAWSTAPPPRSMLVNGREAVVAMAQVAVGDLVTVHHGHDPEIDVLDADSATAIWAMSDELRDRSGRLILVGHGHYHDTYRFSGDGWRIASSRLTRLSIVRGDGVREVRRPSWTSD